jgi:hypothetical protein
MSLRKRSMAATAAAILVSVLGASGAFAVPPIKLIKVGPIHALPASELAMHAALPITAHLGALFEPTPRLVDMVTPIPVNSRLEAQAGAISAVPDLTVEFRQWRQFGKADDKPRCTSSSSIAPNLGPLEVACRRTPSLRPAEATRP